jgi:hypothetical protein
MHILKTLLRRLAALAGLIVVVTALCMLLGTGSVYAAECGGVDTVILSCEDKLEGSGATQTRVSPIWTLLLIVLNILAAGVGIVAVGGLVYAAFLYTTAADKAAQIEDSKSKIVNVCVGLVAFGLLYSLIQFIVPGGVFDRVSAPQVAVNEPEASAASGGDTPSGGGGSGGDSADTKAATASFKPGQVLIIGDSITERPKDGRNEGNKGWWQYLLDGKDGMFKFSAEGGSGYVHVGFNGTTFYDRLNVIGATKPKAIIIAGGLNDRGISSASSGIKRYYDELAKILKNNDIPPENVYVMVPRLEGTATAIVPMVKSNAQRIGAKYVEVGSYISIYDNLHPDSEGARDIVTNFKSKSNFDERLK